MLKNLRVKAKHNNMEFKIIGLSDQACSRQTYDSISRYAFYTVPLLVDPQIYYAQVPNESSKWKH